MIQDAGRNAARGGGLAVACQYLLALRPGSVG
jgi:hypothetical protein